MRPEQLRRPGMPKEPDVSVLLFDFGGTLDADGVTWKDRFFRLWSEQGSEVPPEQFDRAFYASHDALVGSIPPTLTLRETVERLGRGVAQHLNAEDHFAGQRVARCFCDEALERLAGNATLLERLAAKYRLGVVSNFYGNLSAVCEETGVGRHLAVTIDSACVGFRKPDPRIFQAALARLNAAPSEAVFVGDSLERDMAGARGIGMRHVLLAPQSSGASREACCPEDRVVHRLEELQEIFL
ncbi:MAG: HAD family hydrolase [Thermoanaerobaculia bacterium]